jgi:UDP-N-acetylglucosamine 2-epimerase (non-hydrolysing)
MRQIKVCTVLGTRPEAIKLAPVIQELERVPEVQQRILVTGQHREILEQMLHLFNIRPHQNLMVMQENQQLGKLTARLLLELDADFAANQPDWVIVQGDTTTAFIGALAAFYRRIPVAHVEAGLRTHDRYNPFPEEINRRFADELAQLHFAPTELARQNLVREGANPATIHVTGNTAIDALLQTAGQDGHGHAVAKDGQRLLLVTAHRRESFGQELLNICHALRALVERNADVRVLYAVHPNPNVTIPVRKELSSVPRVELTAALDYAEFIHQMKECYLLLTDSGGIQEEAPSLGKPVLVMRACTERTEGIEAGTARLVGTDTDRIISETERLLHDPADYARMAHARNPYGDGHAAKRIVRILCQAAGIAPPARLAEGEFAAAELTPTRDGVHGTSR